MSLNRKLEPEVMDSVEDARDYDGMDHRAVNEVFAKDLLAFADDSDLGDVLDVGTATAQLPIELCKHAEDCRIMAIDLAVNMLDVARYNIEAAGLIEQITLARMDAKKMDFEEGMFDVVMSNSIIHHIPEPMECIREMVRVADPDNGMIFVRDLMRPESEDEVTRLVELYAGTENDHCQELFGDSLKASLNLSEIRQLVAEVGFSPDTVQATTDRHWTWAARCSTSG